MSIEFAPSNPAEDPGADVIVERLDGIGCIFIYVKGHSDAGVSEILRDLERRMPGCAPKIYREGQVSIIKMQGHFPNTTPSCEAGSSDDSVEMGDKLQKITCRCGEEELHNESALRLPSANWEELIDFWSCHNREFEQMASRQMRPRTNGILYSHFYFVVERHRVPKCLSLPHREKVGGQGPRFPKDGLVRIYYNEVVNPFGCEHLAFSYLSEHFQMDKTLHLRAGSAGYSIKYIGRAEMCAGKYPPGPLGSGIKVGFRPSAQPGGEDPEINEYFASQIVECMRANSTGTYLNGYEISFILK